MSFHFLTSPLHRENVGTLTLKVSGSIQRKVTSVEKGVHIFEQCLEDSKVEILFN